MTVNENAKQLCWKISQNGHPTFIVGGAVRDLLLGRTPNDFDIMTTCRQDTLLWILKSWHVQTKPVGAAFGVVLAREGDEEFEIAVSRKDIGSDGRHPLSVEDATPEEDAQRRDFTVNAMFMDPVTGQILDFVGGQEDLKNRTIRFVGSPMERIAEDKLRMLRALRFALKLDFVMDPATFQAIKDSAHLIHEISAERIQMELVKMLECGNLRRLFDLLMDSGLMREILPEVAAIVGVRQSPVWHPFGSLDLHVKATLDMLEGESWRLKFAALLHDIGKPGTFTEDDTGIHNLGHDKLGAELAEAIMTRLKFSNEDTEHVVALVTDHMKLHDASKMKKSTLRRLAAESHFDDLVKLDRADVLCEGGTDWDREQLAFIDSVRDELKNFVALPDPLVSGKDLISMGLKPSPQFKDLLTAAMDAQLEGIITTKEEGIDLVRKSI